MKRLASLYEDTLSSTLFLSRLPLSRFTREDNLTALPDFKTSAHTFPIAGFVIGLPTAFILILASYLGLPNLVAALVSIIASIVITGGLHEDGLADVADGFWGGHTKDRKLSIMRDSAIGTYGVLALVSAFSLRFSCLYWVLEQFGIWNAFWALIAISALSRSAMLWPWIALTSVRPSTDESGGQIQQSESKIQSGLSIRYGEPDRETGTWAIILSLLPIAALLLSFGFSSTVSALLIGCALVATVNFLAKRHIGGHTGDVLGATQQMSEIGLYLGLLIAI